MSTNPEPEPDSGPQPAREANLAYGTSHELERLVWDDIDAIRNESLLTQRDMADELSREIEQSAAAPLAFAEIRDTIDRLDHQTDIRFSELESLLAAPGTTSLSLERGLLAELLKEGSEGQQILKRGLVFCKHKRYAEAIEWWTLQRQGLDPQTSGQHLLLLIMESLTHVWASNPRRAEVVRDQVKAHPLFKSVSARLNSPIRPGSP